MPSRATSASLHTSLPTHLAGRRAVAAAAAAMLLAGATSGTASAVDGGGSTGGSTGGSAGGSAGGSVATDRPIAFDTKTFDVGAGNFQVDYSARNDALWVATTQGTLVYGSSLIKVNPHTGATLASYPVPLAADGLGQRAVLAIDVDDRHNTVWTGNSHHNSVTVYDQGTGAVVKIIEDIPQTRHVVADEASGLAFITSKEDNSVYVYDTETFERLTVLPVTDNSTMLTTGLEVITGEGGVTKVYATTYYWHEPDAPAEFTDLLVSFDVQRSAGGAVSFTETGRVDLGVERVTNVVVDTASQTAYASSTATEDAGVVVVDLTSQSVTAHVPTGRMPLTMALDSSRDLLYVNNFLDGTVSVIDQRDNTVLETIPLGKLPNDIVMVDGSAYIVDKSGSADVGFAWYPGSPMTTLPVNNAPDKLTVITPREGR